MAGIARASLQDAYEIARYIHTFYEDAGEKNRNLDNPVKLLADIRRFFRNGPNPCFSQLEHGIVLVGNPHGEITDIDTPLGRWHILAEGTRYYAIDYGANGRIMKIFKKLVKHLRLVKMPLQVAAQGYHNQIGDTYSFYAVTRWNGKQIPPARYRSYQDFKEKKISYEDAKKVWDAFASTHEDLAIVQSEESKDQ